MSLTDGEKQKLWEGCGFKRLAEHSYYWSVSDGPYLALPEINLNNLFKYSPFPHIKIDYDKNATPKGMGGVVSDRLHFWYGFADDPAEALARATLNAFEEKEG